MDIKLTDGCIKLLMQGKTLAEAPVVQCLGGNHIVIEGASPQYRIVISDGIHFSGLVVLSPHLNHVIAELKVHSIVRLDGYIYDDGILLITELSVIRSGDSVGIRIGTPTDFPWSPSLFSMLW